jgi:hypothetical protein
MADTQKPAEVPAQETAAVLAPVVDPKPVEETPVEAAAPAVAATEEPKAAEPVAEAEAPKEEETKEEVKEEVKPVEEGQLSYKAQGLSFPKNLISSKEFFSFGSDAVEASALDAYKRSEKSTEVAHNNIAWATSTGKGLLFVGDKKTPSNIINLSDATEPEVDGANKFHFSAKGNKHSFKAANTAERDNWVAQLKLKIAEAKELLTTVPESETYKSTLESFKPAAPAPAAEETKTEETPAATTEGETAAAAIPAEEAAPVTAAEAAVVEAAAVETPKEEPKRRSASRKRTSFFGFGGKKESKVEEPKAEETAATEAAPALEATEAPATEEVKAVEAAEAAEVAPATEEVKTAEETPATEVTEAPKEKPVPTKRNSIFGVFGRKEKKAAETKPVEAGEEPKAEETAAVAPADETAPVIPPVEATTPLAVDVASPAAAPAATEEAPVAAKSPVEGQTPKEKRKSSYGFNFGRKSPAPVEGEEKTGSLSAFSKLRATINRKSSPKPEQQVETKEEEKKDELPAVPATEETKEETPVVAPVVEEPKPETVATTTPAVTASA